jgi:hypothetical protein
MGHLSEDLKHLQCEFVWYCGVKLKQTLLFTNQDTTDDSYVKNINIM